MAKPQPASIAAEATRRRTEARRLRSSGGAEGAAAKGRFRRELLGNPRINVRRANPKHLKILKQGVTAGNQWREKNRDECPSLSRADLIFAHLDRKSTRLNSSHLG